MRTAFVLLIVALALPLALAQTPPPQGRATPCDGFGGGGGFGGGFGGGPGSGPPNGTFNGARGGRGGPNGTGGDANGTRGNGTFGGGRGQNEIAELNVTFAPAGPIAIQPGDAATVVATLLNSGGSTLHLNLSTGGRPNPNATQAAPQNVTATLDVSSIAIGPGGTASATIAIRVAPTAPQGCVGNVGLLAREVGGNRTSIARLVVDVPAPTSSTPQADAPATTARAVPTAAADATPTPQAQKTTPGASLAFALAMVAAAALRKRR